MTLNEPNGSDTAPASGPVGVGGWLVLPVIGFVGVIVLTTINLIAAISNVEGLFFIFSSSAGAYSELRLPTILSLLFGVAIIVSAGLCLYKIFITRTSLRKFAVGHFTILFVGSLVELWADSVIQSVLPDSAPDPSVASNMVRSIVAALIWIPYFLVSKRVQNTFEKKAVG